MDEDDHCSMRPNSRLTQDRRTAGFHLCDRDVYIFNLEANMVLTTKRIFFKKGMDRRSKIYSYHKGK